MLRHVIAISATILLAGQQAPPLPIKRYEGARQFYELPPGSVAWLPNATSHAGASKAIDFRVFGQTGAFTLEARPVYWFVVNHRAPERQGITYLGVEIVKVYPSARRVATPVYLFRNARWLRPGDHQFSGDTYLSRAFEQRGIREFVALHDGASHLETVDDRFGKWHAIPHGTSTHSWDKRVRWVPGLNLWTDSFSKQFAEPLPSERSLMLDARLLRFHVTERFDSTDRLVFSVTRDNAIAFYVSIFVPNFPEFDRELFLTIDE